MHYRGVDTNVCDANAEMMTQMMPCRCCHADAAMLMLPCGCR